MKHILMLLGLVALACSAALEYDTPERIYDGDVPQDVTDWNTAMGTQLKVAQGKTIGITNGTFAVGNGNSASIGASATLIAFKGATLNFAASANSKSFGLMYDYGRYVLDGATFNVVTKNVQRYFGNGSTSRPKFCSWELVNGSKLDSSTGGSQNEYRWIVGYGNRMTLVDSTLKVGAYGASSDGDRHFHFRFAENCTLSATRSTLTLASTPGFGFAYSTNSLASFTDTTIENAKTFDFAESSSGNTAEFLGTQGTISFTTVNMNGVGDTLRLGQTGFAPTVNIGGTSNHVVLADAEYAAAKFVGNSPIAPTLTLKSGAVVSNQYLTTSDFGPFVDGNTIDVRGGEFKFARYVQFDGTNKTIRVRDGGKFLFGLEPSSTANSRNALRFSPGETSGCTLSIEEDGIVGSSTSIGILGGKTVVWDWTNCPNSKIVFKGRNPRFNLDSQRENWSAAFGTDEEDAVLPDPVVLRFEVPAENYDAAPLRRDEASRPVTLYGNQPIEVVLDPQLTADSHDRLFIPLVYDANGFSAAPLDATRLAKLTAHATLPEKSKFVVRDDAEGDGKTLCLSIPGNKGLTVIVK